MPAKGLTYPNQRLTLLEQMFWDNLHHFIIKYLGGGIYGVHKIWFNRDDVLIEYYKTFGSSGTYKTISRKAFIEDLRTFEQIRRESSK